MKIKELDQQMTSAYLTTSRVDRQSEAEDTHSECVVKQQRAGDTVKLSTNLPAATEARQPQAIRAGRVEEIKSQIGAGTYEVPAQSVAEKMLSKIVMSSDQ